MKLFRELEEVPVDLGPTVVSVGNFDGVHCAHKKVLQKVVERSRQLGASSLAVTFDPHPTKVLRPELAPKLITATSEKIKLLQQTGLDAVLVIPFSQELSLMSPAEFATAILKRKLQALEVHEGANFHFGHRAEGNVSTLHKLGNELGFTVIAYPEMRSHGQVVSSSNIRRLLLQGEVSQARHLLGRVFSVSAPSAHGRGLGHRYTVPTINLAPYDDLVPAHGVYVTRAEVGEHTFDSVTNVGTRPTFGAESFAIETHLLNFYDFDINDETPVKLSFIKWLRAEMRWPDVDALRAQIAKDVKRAHRYFHLEDALHSMNPRVTT